MYIKFRKHPVSEKRKTHVIDVLNKSNDIRLGQIRWWAGWRQYTFQPEPEKVFNSECLEEINEELNKLNKEIRNEWTVNAN